MTARIPMSRRTSALIALVAGPAIGAACPYIQVTIECRAEHSEACVWGKALLPVSTAISTVVIGAIVGVILFALLEWRRRSRPTQ